MVMIMELQILESEIANPFSLLNPRTKATDLVFCNDALYLVRRYVDRPTAVAFCYDRDGKETTVFTLDFGSSDNKWIEMPSIRPIFAATIGCEGEIRAFTSVHAELMPFPTNMHVMKPGVVNRCNSTFTPTEEPQTFDWYYPEKSLCAGNAIYVSTGNDGFHSYSPTRGWKRVTKDGCYESNSFAMATFGDGWRFIIAGGDTPDSCKTSEALIYDCVAERWVECASCTANPIRSRDDRLDGLSGVTLDRHAVVTGGGRKGSSISRTIRYDHRTDTWSTLADMLTPRSHHTSFAIDDVTVVVAGGGSDRTGNVCASEIYDSRADRWIPEFRWNFRDSMKYGCSVVVV